MKKIIFALALTLFFLNADAQMLTPVKWSYAAKKVNATEAIVYVKATIEEGWHVYSQFVKEGGPVKTTFTFPASTKYTLVGKTVEPKPISRMEKTFNMEVGFFEKSVVFQQKIKLKGKTPVTVKGTVEYMTCDDHQCLPPENVEFSVTVK